MRRRSVAERLEQEPETPLCLLGVDPEQREHPLLQFPLVNPDRAAPDLIAVEHDIVGARANRARITLQTVQVGHARRRERMMGRVPAPLVAVPVDQGKIVHPQELVGTLAHVAEAPADFFPQRAERGRRGRRRAGHQEAHPALLDAQPVGERLDLRRSQRFLDQERRHAVLALDPKDALGAVAAGDVRVLVDLPPARPGGPRYVNATHDSAGADRRLKGAELRFPQTVRHVRDLEVDPQVGTVRAVARHRVVVREARVRGRRRDPGERKHTREQALDEAVDILLVHEGHLHVDLRELGLTVGSQVLVAEAARELDVALQAADHQDLLEQLR